jgi:hypothetical protein
LTHFTLVIMKGKTYLMKQNKKGEASHSHQVYEK